MGPAVVNRAAADVSALRASIRHGCALRLPAAGILNILYAIAHGAPNTRPSSRRPLTLLPASDVLRSTLLSKAASQPEEAMTHKDDQDAAIDALKRKQGRTRPEVLNQDTLDRVAHDHAKELIKLGAQSTVSIKRVMFIRHGESAANAGQASRDHESIPLTSKGLKQAITVARSIKEAPELILVSPFARAQATAQQTATVFPSVAFETWPIQEFTYLEPARCVDTTVAERRSWVDEYWARAEPAYADGEGAESFLDFVTRAKAFLDRLSEHPATSIIVFSHGQFLSAVAWLLERKPEIIDGRAMTDWRTFEIENHIPNGCGFSLSRNAGDAAWTLSGRNY